MPLGLGHGRRPGQQQHSNRRHRGTQVSAALCVLFCGLGLLLFPAWVAADEALHSSGGSGCGCLHTAGWSCKVMGVCGGEVRVAGHVSITEAVGLSCLCYAGVWAASPTSTFPRSTAAPTWQPRSSNSSSSCSTSCISSWSHRTSSTTSTSSSTPAPRPATPAAHRMGV